MKRNVWILVDKDGDWVGEGQGSNEYYYTEEAALAMKEEMSGEFEGASKGVQFIRKIFSEWRVVPATLEILATEAAPAPKERDPLFDKAKEVRL